MGRTQAAHKRITTYEEAQIQMLEEAKFLILVGSETSHSLVDARPKTQT